MNFQNVQRLKCQLEKLEAEVELQQPIQTHSAQPVEFPYYQFLNWYKGLTQVGQVVVIGLVLLIGLSLVSTVIKLISLAISLTTLGVIVYLAYRFF